MTVIDDETMALPPQQDAAALAREIATSADAVQGLEYREVLRRADRRGYALFILFAAVLLVLPIPIVFPQIAAATLIVCGLGLLFGAPAPWLPGFLGKRKASPDRLTKVASFFESQQTWSHWILNPRHPEFARGAGEAAVAVSLVLLGLSVAAPLPQAVPMLAALALGLGLLQRDGLVMMIGAAASFGWAAYLITMIAGLWLGAPFAGGWGHENAPWLVNLFTPATGRP